MEATEEKEEDRGRGLEEAERAFAASRRQQASARIRRQPASPPPGAASRGWAQSCIPSTPAGHQFLPACGQAEKCRASSPPSDPRTCARACCRAWARRHVQSMCRTTYQAHRVRLRAESGWAASLCELYEGCRASVGPWRGVACVVFQLQRRSTAPTASGQQWPVPLQGTRRSTVRYRRRPCKDPVTLAIRSRRRNGTKALT